MKHRLGLQFGAVAAAVAAATLGAPHGLDNVAHASVCQPPAVNLGEPCDWALYQSSGEEGTDTDTTNAVDGLLSDVGATGLIGNPGLPEVAGQSNGACYGKVFQPGSEADSSYRTRVAIFADYEVDCDTDRHSFDVTFYLERHRWYGWQTLASKHFSASGSIMATNDVYIGELRTGCRNGTWTYRLSGYGYIDGNAAQGWSPTYREKCVNFDAPFEQADLS